MAQTTTLTICPACGHFVVLPAKQCPVCSAAFDKAVQEGTAIEAVLETAPPTEADIQAVHASPERAAGITGKEIAQALLNFLIACAVGVGMFFFGRWVTGNFRGLGVIFFGIVPMILSPLLVLYGIVQLASGLFGTRRGKTPKAAFEKVWTSGFFNGLSITNASSAAAARVYRSLPDVPGAPSAADLTAYVQSLTQWMRATLEAEEMRLASTAKWKNGAQEDVSKWSASFSDPSLVPGSIAFTALAPNVHRVSGVLCTTHKRTTSAGNDKTNELVRCALLLTITCYCVRHGKYWLITDAMPPLPALPGVEG